MNVLNELTEDRLRLLARELKRLVTPNGQVLVIEPAAQTPSRHVIQFRDACTDTEWHIAAPCPHALGCPMLLDERDWCHGTWPFQRPSFMEEVDSRVGTRRETLKATWFSILSTAKQRGDRGHTGARDQRTIPGEGDGLMPRSVSKMPSSHSSSKNATVWRKCSLRRNCALRPNRVQPCRRDRCSSSSDR